MEREKVEVSVTGREQLTELANDWRASRAMDLNMLSIPNARERDADEWASIFAEADTRFKFQGVKRPPGSNLAIMEAIWHGRATDPETSSE